MIEILSCYHINDDTFIKVELKENDTVFHVDIFYKVNNKYRVISQNELPNNIINIISTTKSIPLTKDEENDFRKFYDKLSFSLKDSRFDTKTILGKFSFTNYFLSKEYDLNYYSLQTMIVNEFGVMTHTAPIMTTLIPYVFSDLIKKGNKFKKQIYLIAQDTFVQLCEVQNKVLGIIYQFNNNGLTDAVITIVGLFLLEKGFNGETKISTSQDRIDTIKNLDIILEEQMNKFIEKLNLQKINNK